MLLTPTLNPISIQVCDRVDGKTVLHQIAHSHVFQMSDQPDGSVVLRYTLRVTPHAVAADGSIGTANPFGYEDRLIPLLADNDTAVNPQTGELLYIGKVRDRSCYDVRTGKVIEFAEGETWLSWLEAQPEKMMLQGFQYAALRDEPVALRAAMVLNIQQANAMGKFA